MLNLCTSKHGRSAVISIAGDIDASTVPDIDLYILSVMEGLPPVVILDLVDVNFMGSSGLIMIIDLYRGGREKATWLAIAAAQPGVRKVLDLAELTKIIPTYPSVEEALAAVPYIPGKAEG